MRIINWLEKEFMFRKALIVFFVLGLFIFILGMNSYINERDGVSTLSIGVFFMLPALFFGRKMLKAYFLWFVSPPESEIGQKENMKEERVYMVDREDQIKETESVKEVTIGGNYESALKEHAALTGCSVTGDPIDDDGSKVDSRVAFILGTTGIASGIGGIPGL
jgi:hypothetical protein